MGGRCTQGIASCLDSLPAEFGRWTLFVSGNPLKPDPLYAIRVRKAPRGTTFFVRIRRRGKEISELFRETDHGSASAALKAAQQWRDAMLRTMMPETNRDFSQRLKPNNTSGHPGVYFKRQLVKRGDWQGEYHFWQAQTPQGVKPYRSRSFSVTRYGHEAAYAMAVQAREEFVQMVAGYANISSVPKRFRPAE